jgi:hypothetical protein
MAKHSNALFAPALSVISISSLFTIAHDRPSRQRSITLILFVLSNFSRLYSRNSKRIVFQKVRSKMVDQSAHRTEPLACLVFVLIGGGGGGAS